MSRRLKIVLIALAVVMATTFFWWMTRAPVVFAVTLGEAPLVRTLQFSARVATLSRVDVGSTLTGRVQEVRVAEGAQVRKGDMLVRLESDELRAAFEQAQAAEQQAAARLAGLRSTGRGVAQAAVAQSNSVLIAAQLEFKRTQELVAQGFLSPAQLDNARRAVDVAKAQQNSALAQNMANAENGTEVAQAKAQLMLANSGIAAAKARLLQSTLSAPADARVLVRFVEPGQIVQPGRALLTLALSGPLQVVAQVDERYLEQLRVGQVASVLADAFPGQRFVATVASISPLVDAQRGAIEVKFSLADPTPSFLREDMTLSVEVETGQRQRALVVPTAALRGGEAAATATVLLVSNGRAVERKVRLGLRTLDAVEVIEGLKAGDTVLVGGALKDGARVRAEVRSSTSLPHKKGANEDAASAMTNAMGR